MAKRKFSNRRPHTKRQQQAVARPAKKKMPTSRKPSHSVPVITLRWGNKKLEIDKFVTLLTSLVGLATALVGLIALIVATIAGNISHIQNMQIPSSTPAVTPSYTISAMSTRTGGLANTSSITATTQPTYTPSPFWILTATVTPIPTNLPTESLQPKPTHNTNPSPTSTTILLATVTPIPTQSITTTSTNTTTAVATNTSTSTPTYTSMPTGTPSMIATATSSHTPTYTPPVTPTLTSTANMTPILTDTPSLSSTPTPLEVSTASATGTPAWTQTQTFTPTPFLNDTLTPTPPINEDGQGCSPGYWKNHFESWQQTGYSPTDDFDTVFQVNIFSPDITLEQALNLQGGGDGRLARHGVAALLNASDPEINYPFMVQQVIAAIQADDIDKPAEFNELDCPLH